MSDELQPEDSLLEHRHTEDGIGAVERTMNELIYQASADFVFGEPVEQGNTTVIPCAEVFLGMGMGVGSGGGGGREDEDNKERGGGGGGGGGSRGRPVAAIIITPDNVRVEPIVDVTKVALAAITTGGFIIFWLARLLRANGKAESENGPSLKDLQRAVQE